MATLTPGVVRDLGEKAMVTRLNVSRFHNSKLDKKASKETNRHMGSEKDSLKTYKPYFRRKDPVMKAVTRQFGLLDKIHKDPTIPHDNNGGRLLNALFYYDFCKMLRVQIDVCNDLYLNEFIPAIPRLTRDAEKHLGPKVFNINEYPTQEELRDGFIIHHEFEVISSGSQAYNLFSISDDDKERIALEIDKRVEEKLQNNMHEPWKRLHEAVQRVVNTLSDPDKGFHKTMITNVAHLVEIMPVLNIGEDPNLDDMVTDIRNSLVHLDISDLKDDMYYRQDAAADAQKILDDMGAFFTP